MVIRRIEQSQTGHNGDCWRACVAMVIGYRLEDVPHFTEESGDQWWEASVAWLRAQGFAAIRVVPDKGHHLGELIRAYICEGGAFIAVGLSRGDRPCHHAVVYYRGPKGLQVLDPGPGQRGLSYESTMVIVVPIR